jgi:predicted AAA+ superfamily ATPase
MLGPRQSGKTTLARQLVSRKSKSHFFDLETANGRARLNRLPG